MFSRTLPQRVADAVQLHKEISGTLDSAANDNPQPRGAGQSSDDDNTSIIPLAATGTNATPPPNNSAQQVHGVQYP